MYQYQQLGMTFRGQGVAYLNHSLSLLTLAEKLRIQLRKLTRLQLPA